MKMRRWTLFLSVFALMIISINAFAEQITLTTYYPAPYGVYREFEVKESAAVGAISETTLFGLNEVGDLDKGELWVQGSVIFEPKPDDPSTWPDGWEGELAYSAQDDEFYYYNGTDGNWVAQAGAAADHLVVWGTITCPPGYTSAYDADGGVALLFSTGGAAGGVVCSDTAYNTYIGAWDIFWASTRSATIGPRVWGTKGPVPCTLCYK